jgi:hypothetical protein
MQRSLPAPPAGIFPSGGAGFYLSTLEFFDTYCKVNTVSAGQLWDSIPKICLSSSAKTLSFKKPIVCRHGKDGRKIEI